MKELLYTIPLMDAFHADDECPFCFIERDLEEQAINFVLGPGASYMEDDVRGQTDQQGFCRSHFKKLYDYGNRLGCGLILSTHIKQKNKELEEQIRSYRPVKMSFLSRIKKNEAAEQNTLLSWLHAQKESCYICNRINNTYERYMDTFFELYKKDPDFVTLVKNSKGFCLHHLEDLLSAAYSRLSEKEFAQFIDFVLPLVQSHMKRVEEDIEWFCDKFDYRNKDADWRNSKDALQRAMQKVGGGHPADPPFTQDL